MSKKVNLYFSFLIILCLLSFFYSFFTSSKIGNWLGEKLFLEYHQNQVAIAILKSTPPDYRTYFLLGRLYFVEGKLYESIHNYTESINLNPNHKESYYGRGLAYGFVGEIYLTQAEIDFQKYIDIDNQEFKATGKRAYGAWAGYNDLAWVYFLKGDFKRAEVVARQGLEISNLNPWLSNILGVLLLEKKECPEAKILLENAKVLLESIGTEQFGEAYSGDDSDFWEIGKKQFETTIKENLHLCEK